MSKKRDDIARRRQITRTRKGIERTSHEKPTKPPAAKKKEEKAEMKDLWIAVGIVVLIIAAFVALYYFAVRKPPTSPVSPTIVVRTSTPVASEPVTPTLAATGAATSTQQPSSTERKAMSWNKPPEMTIDPAKSYEAVMKTTKGDVRIKLFADKAPKTVNNFVFLARQGFYNNVVFHRVIAGFMAQTGDPTGTGTGGPGYKFADEFSPDLRHDGEGIVSMANAGPNTNGSQFFITYAPQPHLNDVHSVFGKVVEGMDVIKAIPPRDPSKGGPAEKILSIEIIEK
jgi:cyclophilin family peptidyl-prolyl cis-trans isomerase